MSVRITAVTTTATSGGGRSITALDVFIFVLRLVKVLAVLSLLAAITAHCLTMKGAVDTSDLSQYTKAFTVMGSIGFSLLCLVQVVAEFEPSWFRAQVRVLHYWAARGLLLAWQGVELIYSAEQLSSVISDIDRKAFRTASAVVGWALIGIGAFYAVMAVLCLRKLCGIDDADTLDVKIMSDERMEAVQRRVGIHAQGGGGGGGSSDRAAAQVISNMAIALDLTSARAWEMFGGPGGADEARRIRQDHLAATEAREREVGSYEAPGYKDRFDDGPDSKDAPILGVVASGGTYENTNKNNSSGNTNNNNAGAGAGSGSYGGGDGGAAADDEDPRARRRQQEDDLEREYYASMGQ